MTIDAGNGTSPAPVGTEPAGRGAVARVERLIGRLRLPRRWALLPAVALFVVAFVVALRNLPEREATTWWLVVVAAVVGVPVTALLNAGEYRLMGAMTGFPVGSWDALRVSIVASAANLLPIPGAAVVRVEALRRRGARVGHGVHATIVIALFWVGVAAVAAGIPQLWTRPGLGGALVAGGGTVVMIGGLLLARGRERGRAARLTLSITAIELAFALTSAGRLFLVARGLHLDITFAAALVLGASGAIAAAAGFFPGGFGLREVLAGVFAPAVGLAASVGVVVAAVERVASLAVLAVLATIVVLLDRRRDEIGEGRTDAPA